MNGWMGMHTTFSSLFVFFRSARMITVSYLVQEAFIQINLNNIFSELCCELLK